MAFALLAYLCRNMYHRYLYKIADTETGVFTIGERATKIAKLANLKSKIRKYRPHRFFWNADYLTIASALLEPCMPRINFEQRIHNGKVAVDIAHPNNASRGRVAFLLPGVGGDSNSTYVRAAASSLLEIGYSIVVIHSRGLGDHTPHLENPLSSVNVNTLVDDIRDVIQSYFPSKMFYEGGSSQHYTHGVVIGFSLGMFSCISELCYPLQKLILKTQVGFSHRNILVEKEREYLVVSAPLCVFQGDSVWNLQIGFDMLMCINP